MCRSCTNTGLPLCAELDAASDAGRLLAELLAPRLVSSEEIADAVRRGLEDRRLFEGQRQDQPDGDVERVRTDQSERFKDREIPEQQVSDQYLDHNWDMTLGHDPTKETQQQVSEPPPQQMTRSGTLDDRYDFQGLKLSIENSAGSTRSWYDKDAGEHGETTMRFDYGYVRMSEGTDGDHVDVYVGPNREADTVWVVNQMRKPAFTEFDEQKCMIGFDSEKDARDAYLQHYDDDRFLGEMFEMAFDDFKAEVLATRGNGKRLKPKRDARLRLLHVLTDTNDVRRSSELHAAVLRRIADWFDDLGPGGQQTYVDQHPGTEKQPTTAPAEPTGPQTEQQPQQTTPDKTPEQKEPSVESLPEPGANIEVSKEATSAVADEMQQILSTLGVPDRKASKEVLQKASKALLRMQQIGTPEQIRQGADTMLQKLVPDAQKRANIVNSLVAAVSKQKEQPKPAPSPEQSPESAQLDAVTNRLVERLRGQTGDAAYTMAQQLAKELSPQMPSQQLDWEAVAQDLIAQGVDRDVAGTAVEALEYLQKTKGKPGKPSKQPQQPKQPQPARPAPAGPRGPAEEPGLLASFFMLFAGLGTMMASWLTPTTDESEPTTEVPPLPKPIEPESARNVLAQIGAPAVPAAPAAAGQAIQQADPEPEYDVGDEVMLKNTIMGLRKNDRGVVVGMQGTMVGVVFFNRPEAAMYIDKDLLKKAPPKKEEGGGGGWGGGWGKKKSLLETIGVDTVHSGGQQ